MKVDPRTKAIFPAVQSVKINMTHIIEYLELCQNVVILFVRNASIPLFK